MAPIAVGDTLPDGTLAYFDEQDQLQTVSVHSLAAGKKVVLFGVPGAFTPTCSMKHVPGFIEKSEELKSKGVEELLLISVNDPFVMKAWKKSYPETKNVKFLADGSASYTHALGLELDLNEKGLGIRSRRFALLVDNLKVTVANIESGGEFTVSSADEILSALLQDLAVYGVAVAVSKEISTSFPDRTFRSPIVDLLIKVDEMTAVSGKNNGKGYYIYAKGSKPTPDAQVLPIIEQSKRLVNMIPGGKPISVTDQGILELVLFPVVNEACWVLEEGVVVRASVLGMSFPSYRGGIVFWGDLVGVKHIYASLKRWSEKYGNFYKPSRFLEERAKKGVLLSAPLAASASSRAHL